MNRSAEAMVIAHGKSEIALCGRIAAECGIRLVFDSNNGGNNATTIEMLPRILSSKPYTSEVDLHKAFPDLQYIGGRRASSHMPDVKIFTVMDIDADTRNRRRYVSGEMFKGLPLEKRLVPIFNDDNLDQVMEAIGFDRVRFDKPRYYQQAGARISENLIEYYRRLRDCEKTNLDEFILYCMSRGSEFQGYLPDLMKEKKPSA